MIRFGPAGWDYDDWKGIVYPDPKPKKFGDLLRRLHSLMEPVIQLCRLNRRERRQTR